MLDPPAGRDALPAGEDTPPGVDDHALLDGLTGEQAQAARHDRGPLLIYAGPGAGKTRTLIYRIARLLATGAARPWEILAVTFSVRAAVRAAAQARRPALRAGRRPGDRGDVSLGLRADAQRARPRVRTDRRLHDL